MATAPTADELEALGLEAGRAATLSTTLQRVLAPLTPAEPKRQEASWRELVQGPLSAPMVPFAVYRDVYRRVYEGRDLTRQGPGPAWIPPADALSNTHLGRWMRDKRLTAYRDFHRWTIDHRDSFWDEFIHRIGIRFRRAPTRARDPTSDVTRPRWLPGAQLNIVDSCFRADPSKAAIVWAKEGDAALQRVTFGQLRILVQRVANSLDRLGLSPRERIALYLPMTMEAVAVYLAIILTGRSVVGIADASAAPDVEKRLQISGAKVVFTVDSYVRDGKTLKVYEKSVAAKAPTIIVLPGEGAPTKLRAADKSWSEFLGPERPHAGVACTAEDTTNILFSSGTTKDPKAIVWTQTTPLKCVMDAYLHHDVHAEDVIGWPTSYGWMMGPWLTFASLVHGATMALYNGSPTSRGFGQFVEDAGVTLLGVVPKMVRSWKAQKTMEGLDWSKIRRFSSTGETSDPDEMLYLMWLAGTKPVIEYCGGTEIGGGYVTGTMVQAAAPSMFTTASCGLDFLILDEQGKWTKRGEVGIVPPSIGLSSEILNYDHHKEYYEGFFRGPKGEILRRHGDQLEQLGGGYYKHHGRIDDMININGVKTSVEELRAVLLGHEAVYDLKPFSADADGNGQHVLVVYAVPRDKARVGDTGLAAQLKTDLSALIKTRLNPLLAHVHEVVLVPDLPQAGPGKTRTQKEFRQDYAGRRASAPALT